MVSQLQYNAAANWVREELFQSKLMRENGLEGQYGGRGGQLGRLEKSFCLFSICVVFYFWRVLPGLQDEEVYKDSTALSPSLSLFRSLSRFIFASA